MDWLFTKGRMISDNNRFTHELATRLVESGAPLDGLRIMVRTLNPQVLAYSDFWSSSDNATHTATARHGVRSTDRYIGSPLQDLGDHAMKGIDGLQKVFGLAEV